MLSSHGIVTQTKNTFFLTLIDNYIMRFESERNKEKNLLYYG
jgi:hypothetical protein